MTALLDVKYVAGDGHKGVEILFVNDDTGGAEDLSAWDAMFGFRIVHLDDHSHVIQAGVNREMVIQNPPAQGLARYQFTPAELLGGTEWELIGGIMLWDAYLWDGVNSWSLTAHQWGQFKVRGRQTLPSGP